MADYRDEHSSNLKKLNFVRTPSPEKKTEEINEPIKKHNTKITKASFKKKTSLKNKKEVERESLYEDNENLYEKIPERKMTGKKKNNKRGMIACFVFFGIILFLILVTVITPNLSSGVKTGYVQNGEIEKSVEGQVFFLRDETTVKSEFSGKVIAAINEGERASKDEVVAYVVDGDHQEIVEELKRIEDRIISAQTYNDNVSDSVSSGLNDVSTAVLSEINNLTPYISKGCLRSFSEVKSNINSLFNMQSEMTLNVESKDEYILLLQQQRDNLMTKLKGHMYELKAPEAGVVSYCVDGKEEYVSEIDIDTLNSASLSELTQNAEKTVGREISKGQDVFRITSGNEYYIAATLSASDMENIKENANVVVQAKNHSFKAKAQVVSITEEGDNAFVVFKSSSNMPTTISYRVQEVNIIFESVSGMKIPMRAITDWDTAGLTAKVTVIRSNTVYGIYVNVLSKNEEYAIVTNKTAFSDLSEVSGLKPNDMYVHNPDSVTEGEIIG